jgi:hypothetical protein
MIVNQKISFSEKHNKELNERIKDFVNQLDNKNQSTGYYSFQRKTTIERARKNLLVGKKAEFFAAYYLRKHHGFPYPAIDLEIREGKNKGWQVDLPYNNIDALLPNVHVKSCDSDSYKFCQDFSWTFQYGNNFGAGGKDEIFDDKHINDYIILVYLNIFENKEAEIKFYGSWSDVKGYLKLPLSPKLQKIKRCLYFKDLENNFSITCVA